VILSVIFSGHLGTLQILLGLGQFNPRGAGFLETGIRCIPLNNEFPGRMN
jgi:hypothetical protein